MLIFARTRRALADFVPNLTKKSFVGDIISTDHRNKVLSAYLDGEVNRARILISTLEEKDPRLFLNSLIEGNLNAIDEMDSEMNVTDSNFWICVFFELAKQAFHGNDYERCEIVLTKLLHLVMDVYNSDPDKELYQNWMTMVLLHLAQLNFYSSTMEYSLAYCNQALTLKQILKQDNDLVFGYIMLYSGECHLVNNETDKALDCISRAQVVWNSGEQENLVNDWKFKMMSLSCRCLIHDEQIAERTRDQSVPADPAKIKDGYAICNQGIEMARKLKATEDLQQFYQFRAVLEVFGCEFKKALATLEESAPNIKELPDELSRIIFAIRSFDIQLQCYTRMGLYEESIRILKDTLKFLVAIDMAALKTEKIPPNSFVSDNFV
jgi:tetratricopeptide (TPR) repeat protein